MTDQLKRWGPWALLLVLGAALALWLRPAPAKEAPVPMAEAEAVRIVAEKERVREVVADADEKRIESEVVAATTDPDERASAVAALLNKRRTK